jgi:carbon-monoxide dehydrogenase large subunit
VSSPLGFFGTSQLRTEDARFLKGQGRYIENIPAGHELRAWFVRSILAHARLTGVDTAEAMSMPGVAAVFTSSDLELGPLPPAGNVEGASGSLGGAFERPILASEVVRFVGEPIAVILADSAALAEDAAEAVTVDYDPLDVVVDPEIAAAEDAAVLFPEQGTNVCHSFQTGWDKDVLAGSDVVVSGRFVNQRLIPVPMETNGILVEPDEAGNLTIYVSTQVPFDVRSDVASALGIERERIRVVAPDVGGGFGAKLSTYPEYLVTAAAALRLERPVRWIETRTESMQSMTHGRAQIHRVEIGASEDGRIVGLRADILADMGAYPAGAFLPTTTEEMLSGVYRIPAIASRGRSVVTNKTPVYAYRGAGRPEAAALIERAVSMLADELGMDPVELRRKNLIPPDAFPYKTVSGTEYDTGDYGAALDEALRLAGYERLRAEQASRRARGDHIALGIGVSAYVEITSFSSKEYASVEVDHDGSVKVLTGTSPHGQGHETAFAQLASGVLGIGFGDVTVIHSDSSLVPRGEGTWGSRSLQAGGSSVYERANEVLEKARRVAAHLLEVDTADVVAQDGGFHVTGAPEREIQWSEVASAASDGSGLPEGLDPGLHSEGRYREPGSTFPFGAHVSVVEVDTETGEVRPVRHVAVDDCGRILNPLLVDGQVHGGLGQGIAQALYEETVFDESGNPLTSNLSVYQMPSAAELPPFELSHTETPTPLNPLGAKGIGESATIGSTPAVQNAVVDALSHLGVRHIDLPLSPERVLAAIGSAG